MRVRRAAFILVVAALAGCTTAPPSDDEPDVEPYEPPEASGYGWVEASPVPYGVGDAACTLFDDNVWLFGGVDGTGFVTSRAAVFEPGPRRSQERWESLLSLPSTLHGANAVPIGDRIQIVGGYQEDARRGISDQVVEYIPASGFYNPRPIGSPLGEPLAEATVIRVDDRPALAGGTHDGVTALDSILVWQSTAPFSAGWQRVEETLPVPRAAGGVGMSPEGFRVLAGGWGVSPGDPVQQVDMQNTDNGRSILVDGVPTPRPDAGVGAWDQRLFVVGGRDADGTPVSTVELLDMNAKQWLSVLDLPAPVARPCVVALPDGLHVIGGLDRRGEGVAGHWVLQELE